MYDFRCPALRGPLVLLQQKARSPAAQAYIIAVGVPALRAVAEVLGHRHPGSRARKVGAGRGFVAAGVHILVTAICSTAI